MRVRFLASKAANTFLAGSAILLFTSCLPTSTPTNAPNPSPYAELTSAFTATPDPSPNEGSTSTSPPGELPTPVSSATQIFPTATPSSYAELTSTFTATPGFFPNEEPTSPPGEPPTPVSSATQTFSPATSNNTPTSDLKWSSHYFYNGDIIFRYPEHWKSFYAYGEVSSDWKSDFYICVKEPDKDVGLFFHYPYSTEYPKHPLEQWAEDGMDIRGLISFKPETVVDDGNIVIAGQQSFILTAQGDGLTVQATYSKLGPTDMLIGLVWYAPSDQWDSMGEIFSEILASITRLFLYYPRDGIEIGMMKPGGWSSPIGHPYGKGTWEQSADQKIGMLIGMMPQGDPSKLLADWTPGKLSSLGFSNCNVHIPGDRMEAVASTADTMQGKCLDDSGAEVTYTVGYLKVGNDRVGYSILEVVTYFPTMQSERAWILSFMFESIHSAKSVPLPKELENCEGDLSRPECNPG
jgi:hypothetical protein